MLFHAPWPAASKVAGVARAAATGARFSILSVPGERGGHASSSSPFARPGNDTNAVAGGGAIAGPIGVGGESPRGHKNAWELEVWR